MVQLQPPFLFEHVERLTRSRLRPRTLVVAGPFMGKSSILDRLEAGAHEAGDKGVRLDLERDERPEIPDGAAYVFVDNAHADEARFSELVDVLDGYGAHLRIVATSEHTPGAFADAVGVDKARGFTRLELDPWSHSLSDTRARHARAWETAWSMALDELRAAYPEAVLGTLPPTWIDRMFDLTTGHPALVEIAFELTVLTYESYLGADTTHEEVCKSLASVEPFLRTQLSARADVVADQVLGWIDEKAPELRSVLAESGEPRGISFEQERALRTAGLVHGTSDFLAWVAPDVLRPLVARRVVNQGFTQLASVAVNPDPGRPDVEGTVDVYPGTSRHVKIRLRGRGWRVFRELHEANGDVVSIEALLEKLEGANSPQIVRSAVQRITDRLKAQNAPRLIENHHGKGYAFAMPPPTTAERVTHA